MTYLGSSYSNAISSIKIFKLHPETVFLRYVFFLIKLVKNVLVSSTLRFRLLNSTAIL